MSKPRLDGKVAIITGAASGIGEATARLFAENGAFIIIADVQDDLGHQVMASIGPDKSYYKHCDVTDENQVQETVGHTFKKYGRLDIVFSNAGVLGTTGSILEMDMGDVDRTMAVNMRGAAAFIKHAARVMVANQIRGSIICTASIAATMGGTGPHAYTISKHALLGLVRSASSELGKHGIRVNCISPFAIPTRMSFQADGWDQKSEAMIRAMSNLQGILLEAGHVAEAALFLASDESCFISGHNLVLDGAFSVVNHDFSVFK
ncbi:short-chain dehydrogenase reductase 3b-like [Magnolia sinica]|uniref:short-chain dehydrogenase reductase 3b-like n=1 Tax=Magnolia sinica TaxID=86752 RepID=UPI00265B36D6|nr:short-chain dehydrogenase reductase 3b-like [Magnolia sinica]